MASEQVLEFGPPAGPGSDHQQQRSRFAMGARGAVALQYAAAGALTALWGASLPAFDARLDLGAARLGAILMALAVGALVAMPLAGRLADRWPGRRLLR